MQSKFIEGVVEKKFSRAALTYQKSSSIQQQIVNFLYDEFLAQENFSNVLELGCGTGFLASKILENKNVQKYTAVDISSEMLEQCSQRLETFNSKKEFLKQNIEQTSFRDKYDLVLSASTLHWIQDFEGLLERIKAGLKSDGKLVFSLMLQGSFSVVHETRRLLEGREDEVAITFPSFEGIKKALEKSGYLVDSSLEKNYTESFSSVRDFFTSIRKRGVGAKTNSISPLNIRDMRRLMNLIQDKTNLTGGLVEVQYNVGFFSVRLAEDNQGSH